MYRRMLSRRRHAWPHHARPLRGGRAGKPQLCASCQPVEWKPDLEPRVALHQGALANIRERAAAAAAAASWRLRGAKERDSTPRSPGLLARQHVRRRRRHSWYGARGQQHRLALLVAWRNGTSGACRSCASSPRQAGATCGLQAAGGGGAASAATLPLSINRHS